MEFSILRSDFLTNFGGFLYLHHFSMALHRQSVRRLLPLTPDQARRINDLSLVFNMTRLADDGGNTTTHNYTIHHHHHASQTTYTQSE